MQRADARVATPREDQLVGAAHADELVVDQVRCHAHQREMLLSLANDFMPGGVWYQVGEPFHRDRVAVADGRFDSCGEGHDLRHDRAFPVCDKRTL
jgi:hypothetical protein